MLISRGLCVDLQNYFRAWFADLRTVFLTTLDDSDMMTMISSYGEHDKEDHDDDDDEIPTQRRRWLDGGRAGGRLTSTTGGDVARAAAALAGWQLMRMPTPAAAAARLRRLAAVKLAFLHPLWSR